MLVQWIKMLAWNMRDLGFESQSFHIFLAGYVCNTITMPYYKFSGLTGSNVVYSFKIITDESSMN